MTYKGSVDLRMELASADRAGFRISRRVKYFTFMIGAYSLLQYSNILYNIRCNVRQVLLVSDQGILCTGNMFGNTTRS